jgi:hypothetical protein
MKRAIPYLLAFFTLPVFSAVAQVKDKNFSEWQVYTLGEGGSKQCYVLSEPVKSAGTFKNRGKPYVIVAAMNGHEEISLSSGYEYKSDKPPVAELDGKKEYKLIAQGETAWAPGAKEDKDIIAAMQRSTILRIKGASTKGTTSIDRYSLSGFTKAYQRMKEVCKAR